MRRIEIYDTTLRDGSQGEGINFSLEDKLLITRKLDELGIDFVEGGYPLSNPKDEEYFVRVRELALEHVQVAAFGMTRRRGVTADADIGLRKLVEAQAPVITIVGKSWDLHVSDVLRVSREENLAMIRESVSFCRAAGRRVFYDAEHFFDGFKHNADFALESIAAAHDAGAEVIILCDTNGGSLPGGIAETVAAARTKLGDGVRLGIHCHNDCDVAVANSLAAVDCGAIQV